MMGEVLGAGIPLLFGALFMTIGLLVWRSGRRLRDQGVQTAATVVRLKTHRDMDSNRTMYAPVVQWVTADGQTMEVASSTSSGAIRDKYRPGATVTVFYDPAKPTRMLIDGYEGAWLAILFCVFGGLALVAAFIVIGVLVT